MNDPESEKKQQLTRNDTEATHSASNNDKKRSNIHDLVNELKPDSVTSPPQVLHPNVRLRVSGFTGLPARLGILTSVCKPHAAKILDFIKSRKDSTASTVTSTELFCNFSDTNDNYSLPRDYAVGSAAIDEDSLRRRRPFTVLECSTFYELRLTHTGEEKASHSHCKAHLINQRSAIRHTQGMSNKLNLYALELIKTDRPLTSCESKNTQLLIRLSAYAEVDNSLQGDIKMSI